MLGEIVRGDYTNGFLNDYFDLHRMLHNVYICLSHSEIMVLKFWLHDGLWRGKMGWLVILKKLQTTVNSYSTFAWPATWLSTRSLLQVYLIGCYELFVVRTKGIISLQFFEEYNDKMCSTMCALWIWSTCRRSTMTRMLIVIYWRSLFSLASLQTRKKEFRIIVWNWFPEETQAYYLVL